LLFRASNGREEMNAPAQKVILLIDEDKTVQKLWHLSALRNNKTLLSFDDNVRFLKHSQKFEKSTPVFTRNEQQATELRKEGYQNIYVTGGDITYRRNIHDPDPIENAH
jgi:hypothetical protein